MVFFASVLQTVKYFHHVPEVMVVVISVKFTVLKFDQSSFLHRSLLICLPLILPIYVLHPRKTVYRHLLEPLRCLHLSRLPSKTFHASCWATKDGQSIFYFPRDDNLLVWVPACIGFCNLIYSICYDIFKHFLLALRFL